MLNKIRQHYYQLSAFLSGLCLVAMLCLILSQVAARFINIVIPSSEDFAGWLLSATIFFGLAYTFNEGKHIRVTMLLAVLPPKIRKLQEFFNIIVALFIGGYFAFYTLYTVYESFNFKDVTDTYIVIPLWIIQTPMALGSLFLFIAIIDNFAEMLLGRIPRYIMQEDKNNGVE